MSETSQFVAAKRGAGAASLLGAIGDKK